MDSRFPLRKQSRVQRIVSALSQAVKSTKPSQPRALDNTSTSNDTDDDFPPGASLIIQETSLELVPPEIVSNANDDSESRDTSVNSVAGEGGSSELEVPPDLIEFEADDNIEIYDKRIVEPRSTLCSFCEHLVDNWPEISVESRDKKWSFQHYQSYTTLRNSSKAGCGLCVQFINSLPETPLTNTMDKAGTVDDPILSLWHFSISVPRSDYLLLEFNLRDNRIAPSLVAIPAHPSVTLSSNKSRYSSPTTESMLEQCKTWMSMCTNSHQGCEISHFENLPSRLLSIDTSSIKLCLTSDLKTRPHYATLSHCWGNYPFLTLRTDNFGTFQKRVPSAALTKTFRDAICITKYLGIKYLWIDSLCIIQDDEDDWAMESALMSSIYGSSTINIAASSASDGSYGCFLHRNELWGCQLATNSGIYDCVPGPGHFENSFNEAPLSLRGWVMQERILPVRTLHFTKNQVFWECGETFASEAFPIQISPLFKFQAWTKDYVDNDIGWADLVKHYSRCNLTLTKDKLVAISGLAQFVHSKTNDQYLAGLWRESLCSHLCWFVTPRQIRTRISPYTAPTWSWASLHASVIFWDPYSSITMLPQLTNVEITHTSNDPFGQISYAKLHLSCGHFASAHVEDWNLLREGTGRITLPNGNSLQLDLHPDSELDLDRDRDVYLTSINGSRSRTSIVGLILNPLATWLGNTKGWDCLLFTSLVTK